MYVFGVFIGMSTLSCYCFLGVLATSSFEKMGDSLYESNWMDFPVEMQKHLIVMIAYMQKPIYYHGFGILNVDLVTFVHVRAVLEQNLHSLNFNAGSYFFSADESDLYIFYDV